MSVVTLFSGSYCHGDKTADLVARELNYKMIAENELFEQIAQRYGLAVERLSRTLYGPAPVLGKLTNDKVRKVALIQKALAERICRDNIFYHGFAAHLCPKDIAHVLRVCLIANQDYRIEAAMEKDGVSQKEARRIIQRDDKGRLQWSQYLLEAGPWDESLYDIVIPMHSHSVEHAVEVICTNIRKRVLETTPHSQRAMDDFVLASQVKRVLAEMGHDVAVSCSNNKVTIEINKHVIRMGHLKDQLRTIASSVPGVTEVHTRLGPKYEAPSIHGNYEFELPPKILLIDDEREFVEVLSERLQTKEMALHRPVDSETKASLLLAQASIKDGTKMKKRSIPFVDETEASVKAISILLVDDDEDFSDTLAHGLGFRGIDTTTAASGDEALEKLDDQDFDVVVLDLLMPGRSGLETLREIKSRRPLIEVIMLSGKGTERTAIEGMQCGAFDFLTKMPDIADLAERISGAYARQKEQLARIHNALEAASAQTQEAPCALAEDAPPQGRLLVFGRASEFSEALVEYALEMAERLSYEVVALNSAGFESETFGSFPTARERVFREFREGAEKNIIPFREAAEKRQIHFTHVVKFSRLDEATQEIRQDIGEIDFVVFEPEAELVGSAAEPGILVYAPA